jgi:hypothetical protein
MAGKWRLLEKFELTLRIVSDRKTTVYFPVARRIKCFENNAWRNLSELTLSKNAVIKLSSQNLEIAVVSTL